MTKKKDLTRIEDLQEFVHKKDETKETPVESEQEPSQEISTDDLFSTPPDDLAQKFAPEESAPALSLPDPPDLQSPAATEDSLSDTNIPETLEWSLDDQEVQAPPLPPDAPPPAPPPSQKPDPVPEPSPPPHQPELQKTIDEIQQLSLPPHPTANSLWVKAPPLP